VLLTFGFASSAHAIPITLEFTVTDIPASLAGVDAPTNPASGVIVYEAAAVGATIDSLISISLDVGNHSFTLADTSFQSPFGIGSADAIYGTLNGTGVTTATSDFFLLYDRVAATGIAFRYSSAELFGIWTGTNFSSFSLSGPVQVSEPGMFSLLVLGLVGALAARRRRV
jgi:MYXO-CTERM domain-containing protein